MLARYLTRHKVKRHSVEIIGRVKLYHTQVPAHKSGILARNGLDIRPAHHVTPRVAIGRVIVMTEIKMSRIDGIMQLLYEAVGHSGWLRLVDSRCLRGLSATRSCKRD